MKTFILKKSQLNEYIENKKAENVLYDIVLDMGNNVKYLKEDMSISHANQAIIESYRVRGLLTPKVSELLEKYKITNENGVIL